MNYKLEIVKLDAMSTVARVDEETLQEFRERQDEARGKSCFRVTALDESDGIVVLETEVKHKIITGWSPFFNEQSEAHTFKEAFAAMAAAIVTREEQKRQVEQAIDKRPLSPLIQAVPKLNGNSR